MVKNIFILIYLLSSISCVRPNIQGDINIEAGLIKTEVDSDEIEEEEEVEEDSSPYLCLMDESEQFIGVTEKGGNNQNFTDRELKQLLVDAGWRPGQAWCSFYGLKGFIRLL